MGRTGGWLWAVGAIMSLGVALVSYRYLPRVGPLPDGIVHNAFANPWLSLHVAGSATALLVSPFQLLQRWRARQPVVHRWVGRLYVLCCTVGGVAGLVLAFGSTAGPVAGLGFGSLAVIWLTVNALAWKAALDRRFDQHRRWMIRSFALTFAAVTLRVYLPLSQIAGLPFLESYRVIAFLAWVPNLMIAELYLRARARPRLAAV